MIPYCTCTYLYLLYWLRYCSVYCITGYLYCLLLFCGWVHIELWRYNAEEKKLNQERHSVTRNMPSTYNTLRVPCGCERSEPKKTIANRKPNASACNLKHFESVCERSEPKEKMASRKGTASQRTCPKPTIP